MLTLRDLSKRYDGHEVDALSGISVGVAEASFTTLLGPSGCGKSTLLRCVAGLEDPRTGEITLAGRTVFDADRRIAVPPNQRALGMVFQSYAIWPHMSVGANIGYPLKVHGQPPATRRAAVNEALGLVDLDGYADRPAYSLSGGQQQRVALARAIVSRPALLLLDEPMSNLDETLRRQLGQELRALQRSLGLTTLYVTHDRNEALTMSDEIVVMRDGRIVERGSPFDLYFDPRTVAGAQAVGEVNVLPAHRKDRSAVCELFDPCLAADCSCHAGEVAIIVRPEHVMVMDREGSEVRPSAPARVVSSTFGGSISEVVLALADGTTLLHRSVQPIRVSPNDEMRVVIDARRIRVVACSASTASASFIPARARMTPDHQEDVEDRPIQAANH